MYDAYMSIPGNTAKLGAIYSNIQTAKCSPSLVGVRPCSSQQTLSQLINPLCQPGHKNRVNHGGLVFRLQEVGVGGMILKVFQNVLSSRALRFREDGV